MEGERLPFIAVRRGRPPVQGRRRLPPFHGLPFRLTTLAGLLSLACSFGPAPPATIRLDPTRTFQTIDGWEVTARAWEFDKAGDRYDGSFVDAMDEIARLLVDEIGVDRVRLEMKSGVENPVDYWRRFEKGEIGYREYRRHFYESVNDDGDPERARPGGFQLSELDFRVETIVRPLEDRLAARGERLFVNACFVDFAQTELRGSLEHALSPDEYAELVRVHFLRLRDHHGIVPDALEVILEPDNNERWTGEAIGRAIVAVARELEGHGFRPQIIAPSTSSASKTVATLDAMLDVPGVAERLDVVAYHRYRGARRSVLEGIAARAEALGKKTAMLEYVPGGFDDLYQDLVVGRASAWQPYAMAGKADVGEDWPGSLVARDTGEAVGAPLRTSRRARELSQVFRHARRGAVRILAESSDDDQRVLAFLDPQRGASAVVDTPRAGLVHFDGLPPARYGARFLPRAGDAAGRFLDLGRFEVGADRRLSVELPAAGLLAVYDRRIEALPAAP